MLDENLPTFHFRASEANPLNSILYFTQNGSDLSPEYVLRRADPADPSSRAKYAIALVDPHAPSVVYAEALVLPNWTQPTLSAAEIRAAAVATPPNGQPGANGPPQLPQVPDTVALQLYNPDQTVKLSLVPGSWNKTDSWEFEMPEQSFRVPSVSEIDRDPAAAAPLADLSPKVLFRWKRDGKLSKDMTCYLVGRSVGGRKSKEPDITVALFKQAKSESSVQIYEPNMARVEVEDRKGLEVVLMLGAELIRELYLAPRQDLFNLGGGAGSPGGVGGSGVLSNGRRRNSRPSPAPASGPSPTPPLAMSGAMGGAASASATAAAALAKPTTGATPPAIDPKRQAEIDAETRRLQAMVAEEERQAREREKRDRKEAERLRKMIEAEEKEARRRQAEVDRETERLRKKYGVEGQTLPSPVSPQVGPAPQLPPRPGPPQFAPPPQQPPQQQHALGGWFAPRPQSGAGLAVQAPPPRPSSTGPSSVLGSWWRGPAAQAPGPQQQPQSQGRPSRVSKKRSVHF